MCLILFAYQHHPHYPLIMASNRDEYYSRPTAPASFWEDHPNILAGRDLEKQGTWMGISRSGRFAALTNYRDGLSSRQDVRTRGELVSNFLSGSMSAQDYLVEIRKIKDSYNGFNLLVGNVHNLYYYSNIGNKLVQVIPGVHGLSNAWLNTPWPKVTKGKRMLNNCLQHNVQINQEELFSILANAEPFSDEELPDTGVGTEWERTLSSLFISSPTYGTRSSTVLLIDYRGIVHFTERTFSSGKYSEYEEANYTFTI